MLKCFANIKMNLNIIGIHKITFSKKLNNLTETKKGYQIRQPFKII